MSTHPNLSGAESGVEAVPTQLGSDAILCEQFLDSDYQRSIDSVVAQEQRRIFHTKLKREAKIISGGARLNWPVFLEETAIVARSRPNSRIRKVFARGSR